MLTENKEIIEAYISHGQNRALAELLSMLNVEVDRLLAENKALVEAAEPFLPILKQMELANKVNMSGDVFFGFNNAVLKVSDLHTLSEVVRKVREEK